MHEHDGSGCVDCACKASFLNTWPCTCPPGKRLDADSRCTDVNIDTSFVQRRLFHTGRYGLSLEGFGEMTIAKSGRNVTICIEIDEAYSDLAEHCAYSVEIYPAPAFPFRPNYPADESHIVRSEN